MDTVFRVTVVYFFVLVGLRILGKREFGQLAPLELVSLLMIPEIVSQALTGDDHSVTTGLAGVATLMVLVFLTSALMHRFERVETLVSGTPTVLVRNGQWLQDAMNRMRVTPAEVMTEVRKAGVESLDMVEWAILESDGSIAIIARHRADAGSASGQHESPLSGT